MVDIARWVREPGIDDDKYTRGVLGVRTGSAAYPGAAVLGVTAAWRTGIGMVRYASEAEEPVAAVLAARPETVFGEGRSDAWLIGSGTDPAARSFAEREALARLLRGDVPVVVDAGALKLALEIAEEGTLAPAILTPHLGEFERLWEAVHPGEPVADRGAAASRIAQKIGAAILLKGSTTIAASPDGSTIEVGPATPWLATAGTGDVLAGMLGALVASNAAAVREEPARLHEIGAAAAALHDAAARIASGTPGRPVTALDVANAVPDAIASLGL